MLTVNEEPRRKQRGIRFAQFRTLRGLFRSTAPYGRCFSGRRKRRGIRPFERLNEG